MKLRYYLRGLGIGMIVTALLMGFATKDSRPMSDSEIKKKAIELGMVESGSLTLSETEKLNIPSMESYEDKNESKEESGSENVEPSEENSAAIGESKENFEENNVASEESKEIPEESTVASEESREVPEESTVASEESKEIPEESTVASEESREASEEKNGDNLAINQEQVSITITSGSGSGTVTKQLKEAGVVEDAKAFDKYLIANNYADRICVGTFEIPAGSSWEEIARIITRSKKR